MSSYYVETFRPAYPAKGIKLVVHPEKGFTRDACNPCMTGLFHVEMARTKAEAVALVIEQAAGKCVTVRRLNK